MTSIHVYEPKAPDPPLPIGALVAGALDLLDAGP